MQDASESSRKDSSTNEQSEFSDQPSVYVRVAVPVHVHSTFIYRIPPQLTARAQPGSRIVVPLGRKVVTGYIVELLESGLDSATHAEIKDAADILDELPIVPPELLELTRWVSDYYLAPWGELIKATLPPGITPAIERFVSLIDRGRDEVNTLETSGDSPKDKLMRLLAETGEVRVASLSDQIEPAQLVKALKELETDGVVHITHRPAGGNVKQKTERRVRLMPTPADDQGRKLTATQTRVLEVLRGYDSLSIPELLQTSGAGLSSVNTLAKRNLVEVFEETLRRDPLAGAPTERPQDYTLTERQKQVLKEITAPLEARRYEAFLLHGVTGSGKTEVYIRAMRSALSLGRSALMLVPEIALTPVFSRRLRTHFGDQVAIFHSSLSRGERFDEWTRVRNGDARVVIGTRSAVFAPVHDLGIVIVDEEHEPTYRQQDSPHYNARDTAIVRAQKESAVVILGSATPSLESFHNAKTGKFKYLEMPERLGNRPLAVAKTIDMREVFRIHEKPRIFSDELLQAIEETHKRGEQSIILLNRRGYSSFVLCRSCGESIQCRNCDVTLTYHRNDRVIVCHYCNHREPSPSQCPSCEGKFIYYVGEGTQQIEEKLTKLFPTLRLARIDRDTTTRRGAVDKYLVDFTAGKIDLLVGTQILAKGHDFPNVTLVGVVSVDAGLALPDFRAAERTFQLLTQVAGRAGRGDRPGKVLIQTYHPYHYALRFASSQDYSGFYQEEIRHRENHTYPPFVSLASLLVHGKQLDKVRSDATEVRRALDAANQERAVRVLGPAPAPLSRLKGEFRMQLLVKSRSRRPLRAVIDAAMKTMADRGVQMRSINIEIDPVSVM